MKSAIRVLQTPKIGLSQVFRQFSSYNPFPGSDGARKSNSVEAADDDFESLISGGIPRSGERGSSFYRSLDKAERAYNPSNRPSPFNFPNKFGPSTYSNFENEEDSSYDMDPSFTTTADGMDAKLKEAASYFEVDEAEIEKEDYSYRPDVNFDEGQTYTIKDLDLRKPAVQKQKRRNEFETTTKEVLEKADFRNVVFLANFITESGIINKRSMTKISAKAQRKVARAIKTARAFGLMPFTTMGTKPFVFDRTMENMEDDFKSHTPGPRPFFDRRADNFGQDFNFVKPEPDPNQFWRPENFGYRRQNFGNTEPGPTSQSGNNARMENFGPLR